MVLPLLSLTNQQEFTALRAFLTALVPSSTEVIQAQVNRVPQPRGANFIVMTMLRQERLEYNETTYRDYDVVGSIAGTVMTVTAVNHGALEAGMTLRGTSGLIAVDTTVVSQLSGSTGGTGTYRITPTQTVGSGVIYAGLRDDLVGTQLTVQLDVYGPGSADTTRVIDTLFFSEVGVDAVAASGYAITPLYCNEARQLPFIDAEQQYENRWMIEAVFQISPVVSTPQQFADVVDVTTIEVDTTYPP